MLIVPLGPGLAAAWAAYNSAPAQPVAAAVAAVVLRNSRRFGLFSAITLFSCCSTSGWNPIDLNVDC